MVPTVGSTGEKLFTTGSFAVQPGSEVFKCQDFKNPFGGDIGITEMTTDLTAGSHHMFAFVMPNDQLTLTDGLVDCPAGGLEFHEYITTTGQPHTDTKYPAGVGRILPGGMGLRLMVHLLNSTESEKSAFVKLNVKYGDPSSFPNKAASLFLNKVGLFVPAGVSTQSASYTLPVDIWLMGDASHMHSRGTHFVAKTGDGEVLYDGTEWAEPKAKTWDPPKMLAAGTQITWSCTYDNQTGRTLTFGESANTNEMCIFPGEFYNSTGGQITTQSF